VKNHATSSSASSNVTKIMLYLRGDEKSSAGCKWDEGIKIYMEILNLILLL